MAVKNIRDNPYVGPRAFATGEKLYGRTRERQQLVDLIIAERLVLLHSPSGAGKSSLVYAGLVPDLIQEEFNVRPVIRVNTAPPESGYNRYVYSMIASLESDPNGSSIPEADYGRLTLEEYFKLRPAGEKLDLLIFDQFEEILTVDVIGLEEKKAFFLQLAALLCNRNIYALFVMREDYLAALDPYRLMVPTYFRNTYRLDFLGKTAAMEAIEGPAASAGVKFAQGIAAQLFHDLSEIQVQNPDGTREKREGNYVEPMQLQVVCFRLWENLAPTDPEIGQDDLNSLGNVDRSLSAYYATRVREAAEKTNVPERRIRNWFEFQLITEGIRGQVPLGIAQSRGLDNLTIQFLVGTHLIRAEKRGETTWYELSHDRLIRPVQQNNSEWLEENLSVWQRKAILWQERNQDPDQLLRGKELKAVENWVNQNPGALTEQEEKYLQACKTAQNEQQKKLRSRVATVLIVATALILLISVLIGESARQNNERISNYQTQAALGATAEAGQATAVFAQQRAEIAQQTAVVAQIDAVRQAQIARMGGLAAYSNATLKNYPQRASLLAIEAVRSAENATLKNNGAALEAMYQALYLTSGTGLSGMIYDAGSIHFSPDNRWLAAVSRSSEGQEVTHLWDLGQENPSAGHFALAKPEEFSYDPLFFPGGRWLATRYEKGVQLWDLTTADPANMPVLIPVAGQIQVSPDQRWVILAGKGLQIWRYEDFQQDPATPPAARLEMYSVTQARVSANGRWLYLAFLQNQDSATEYGLIDLNQMEQGAKITPLPGDIQFELDSMGTQGNWLVGAIMEGTVITTSLEVFDLNASSLTRQSYQINQFISFWSMDPLEKYLFTGNSFGSTQSLTRWSLENPAEPPVIFEVDSYSYMGPPTFSADGRWMVIESVSRNWNYWDLSADNPQENRRTIDCAERNCSLPQFSGDGQYVLMEMNGNFQMIWLENEAVVETFENDCDTTSFTLLPQGNWSARGCENGAVYLNGIEEGQRTLVLDGLEDRITNLLTSNDGQWLAASSSDTTLRVWKLANLQAHANPFTYPIPKNGPVLFAASLDQKWIFANGKLWDLTTKPGQLTLASDLAETQNQMMVGNFSPDSRWFVVINNVPPPSYTGPAKSSNHWLLLYDLSTRAPVRAIDAALDESINVINFSPDHRWLAAGGGDHIFVADLAESDPLQGMIHLPLPDKTIVVLDLVFSADSQRMVVQVQQSGSDNEVISRTLIYPTAGLTGSTSPQIVADTHGSTMLISSHATWMLSDSPGLGYDLWELSRSLEPGYLPREVGGSSNAQVPFAFSPDEGWLIFGGLGLSLLDLNDPASIPFALPETSSPDSSVNIDRSGEWMLVADTYLNIESSGIDFYYGSDIPSMMGWNYYPIASYDGKAFTKNRFLLPTTGGGGEIYHSDQMVYLFNLKELAANPQARPILMRGHETGIQSIAISAQGKYALTSGLDEAVRLWNLEALREDARSQPIVLPGLGMESEGDNIFSLGFSADEHWLFTNSRSGTQIWNLDTGQLISAACAAVGRNLMVSEWQRYLSPADLRQTCPNLPFHPSYYREMLADSLFLMKQGRVEDAIPKIREVTSQLPSAMMDSQTNIQLCGLGILNGYAEDVSWYCDLAERYFATSIYLAVNRAETGDFAGAASKIRDYIESYSQFTSVIPDIDRLTAWQQELEAGRNPFTDEVKAQLREELK